ncbi:MAG: EAL domain-containing protein [Sulfurimonadaceae bacterium]|nr:EAL domain-containing protein [Sulfurimonadaceae bacterium]
MEPRESETFFFARQPILDRKGKIMAYELLYRAGAYNAAEPMPPHATEQVVINALNLTGLGNLLEKGTKAFINIDEKMLFNDILHTIPKSSFVFELLEHIEFTPEIIARVKELHSYGYTFALDDIICSREVINAVKPVLPYVEIVKLDLPQSLENVEAYFQLFKKMELTILAEKVESQTDFDSLRQIGCDLFQGFFFAKPTLISGTKIDPRATIIFRIIQLLNSNEHDEALKIFEQDAALTVQLLRYINSAAFSFKSDIRSVRQAVALLGDSHLTQWLMLMSYAMCSKEGLNSPLLKLAQERSNMMRLFAEHCIDENYGDTAAFAGLLSLIGALFHTPLESLLAELHIDPSISSVLLETSDSELSDIYRLVQCVENVDHEAMQKLTEKLDLSFVEFAAIITESYERTEAFNQNLNALQTPD